MCFIVIGLQGLKIFVPEAVIVGDDVTLACQYDLESVSILSLICAVYKIKELELKSLVATNKCI